MDSPPSSRLVPPRPVLRSRLYEQVADQISTWIAENGLLAGDRLPPERELAQRLGVSRATLSQALVALEVIGVVTVRHGDGTVLADDPGPRRIVEAIRAQDGEEAANAMQFHIGQARRRLTDRNRDR